MKLVTASANRDLDEILDLIGVCVQLTDTQFADAERKYMAVSAWLNADNSPLQDYEPDIFPQGSLRLDTTVKPLSHTEFDLDLVCLLNLRDTTPLQLYNMLLDRMESNGRYTDILEPMDRCIRLNYAGDFHLDIVPAIPDPDCPPGQTCIVIPDKTMKEWRSSNPKGYSTWFDQQALKQKRSKTAAFYERKDIEPLRAPVPAYHKRPLKLAVQLMKRWRDVYFRDDPDRLAPSSIVLTTLAAHLYDGADHPTDAVGTILNDINTLARSGPIRLKNPSNPDEWITDRWAQRPDMYRAFLTAIEDFRVRWNELVERGRYPDFVGELKALFEEVPVTRAVKKFAESRLEGRRNGSLLMERATGVIMTKGATTARAVRVKDHTFFGEE
jgi:hypothetical protein